MPHFWGTSAAWHTCPSLLCLPVFLQALPAFEWNNLLGISFSNGWTLKFANYLEVFQMIRASASAPCGPLAWEQTFSNFQSMLNKCLEQIRVDRTWGKCLLSFVQFSARWLFARLSYEFHWRFVLSLLTTDQHGCGFLCFCNTVAGRRKGRKDVAIVNTQLSGLCVENAEMGLPCLYCHSYPLILVTNMLCFCIHWISRVCVYLLVCYP